MKKIFFLVFFLTSIPACLLANTMTPDVGISLSPLVLEALFVAMSLKFLGLSSVFFFFFWLFLTFLTWFLFLELQAIPSLIGFIEIYGYFVMSNYEGMLNVILTIFGYGMIVCVVETIVLSVVTRTKINSGKKNPVSARIIIGYAFFAIILGNLVSFVASLAFFANSKLVCFFMYLPIIPCLWLIENFARRIKLKF